MTRQANGEYAARDMLKVYGGRVLFGVGDGRRLRDDHGAKVRASLKRCEQTFRPQDANSNSIETHTFSIV